MKEKFTQIVQIKIYHVTANSLSTWSLNATQDLMFHKKRIVIK